MDQVREPKMHVFVMNTVIVNLLSLVFFFFFIYIWSLIIMHAVRLNIDNWCWINLLLSVSLSIFFINWFSFLTFIKIQINIITLHYLPRRLIILFFKISGEVLEILSYEFDPHVTLTQSNDNIYKTSWTFFKSLVGKKK